MKKILESKNNDYIKKLSSLKSKKEILKNELFLIEGENLINEALKSGIVKTLLLTSPTFFEKYTDVEKIKVSTLIIQKLSSNKTNFGAIAVCYYSPKKVDLNTCNKVVILDSINNPGNLGSIIRSARAFDFDAIILLNDSVFPYSDKVIKSSLGTIFEMPILKIDNFELLKRFKVYNFISSKRSLLLDGVEFIKPFGLVFGNEAHGISKTTLQKLEGDPVFVEINKDNVESLNLGVAASIALYMARK